MNQKFAPAQILLLSHTDGRSLAFGILLRAPETTETSMTGVVTSSAFTAAPPLSKRPITSLQNYTRSHRNSRIVNTSGIFRNLMDESCSRSGSFRVFGPQYGHVELLIGAVSALACCSLGLPHLSDMFKGQASSSTQFYIVLQQLIQNHTTTCNNTQ